MIERPLSHSLSRVPDMEHDVRRKREEAISLFFALLFFSASSFFLAYSCMLFHGSAIHTQDFPDQAAGVMVQVGH